MQGLLGNLGNTFEQVVANVLPHAYSKETWLNYLRGNDQNKKYAALKALYEIRNSLTPRLDDNLAFYDEMLPAVIPFLLDRNPSASFYACKLVSCVIFDTQYRRRNFPGLDEGIRAGLIGRLAESLKEPGVDLTVKGAKLELLYKIISYVLRDSSLLRDQIIRLNLMPDLLEMLGSKPYHTNWVGDVNDLSYISLILGEIINPYRLKQNPELLNGLFQAKEIPKLIAIIRAADFLVRRSLMQLLTDIMILKKEFQNAFYRAGGIQLLNDTVKRSEDYGYSACVITAFVKDNFMIQNAVREAGLIKKILARYNPENRDEKYYITEALCNLAENNPENQRMIATYGGINVVADNLSYCRVSALEAIAALAKNNLENQEAFKQKRIIPRIVSLLIDPETKEKATAALISLCEINATNRELVLNELRRLKDASEVRVDQAKMQMLEQTVNKFLGKIAWPKRSPCIFLRSQLRVGQHQTELRSFIANNDIEGFRSYVADCQYNENHHQDTCFHVAVKRLLDDRSINWNREIFDFLAQLMPDPEKYRRIANALCLFNPSQASGGSAGTGLALTQ
ncbi:MAG: hypothetical protein K0S29_496 [Gammaproteobacteria bacterium]|jgi:hypothetical protein|nr:hypothetical protein [Gammaproteobacteria bacterium]